MPLSSDGESRPYTLRDIVSSSLVTIGEAATVGEAARLLEEKLISGVAVSDKHGAVCGVVSANELSTAPSNRSSVRSVMTPLVFSVDVDVPVPVAARLMTDGHLHRLFVEDCGAVIGIVTLTDIARLVGRVGLGTDAAPPNAEFDLSSVVKVDKPREAVLHSLERSGEALTTVFYRRFIASSEEVKRRFAGTDMKRHEKKVAKTLRLAIDVVLNDPASLAELTRQAELHNRHHLDIRPELYDFWLEALVAAVEDCDPRFNRFVEHSWRLLMGHVIQHMVRRY